jgi:hypothetical protein
MSVIIARPGAQRSNVSGSGAIDFDWIDGGNRLKTTSSVSIGSDNLFADQVNGDVFFYVSGSSGEAVSLFGGDVVSSGSVSSFEGFSGSLTKLYDGTSYLIAGPGISIVTQSNGAVVVSSVVTSTLNFVDLEIPSGTQDGTNTTFTLDFEPSPPESLKVVLRGLTLMKDCDYTISGSTLEYLGLQPPISGVHNFFVYYRY